MKADSLTAKPLSDYGCWPVSILLRSSAANISEFDPLVRLSEVTLLIVVVRRRPVNANLQ
jgi:hypothetical protein